MTHKRHLAQRHLLNAKRSRIPSWFLLVMLLIVCVPGLQAQFSSSLEGTVQDNSGAVIPKAHVVLNNLQTGVSLSFTTSDVGSYRFDALPAATYTLTVSAPGFQTVVQKNIQLLVHQVTTVNVKLPVGTATQQVTVSSAPPQIQQAEANVTGYISSNEVASLPLQGRNFYTLAVLTPGVTGLPSGGNQAYSSANADVFNGEYGVNMNASGMRSEQNEFYVDGITVTSMVRGGVVNMNPNADSVQELKVDVNTFSAAYTGAGAHVDVVTKSGTNQFHGGADWFTTNNVFLARNEYQPNGVPTFNRNEFAGSIGGPIRKNRTFFFGTLDVLRSTTVISGPRSVLHPDFINWMAQNLPNNVSTQIMTKYGPNLSRNVKLASAVQASDPSLNGGKTNCTNGVTTVNEFGTTLQMPCTLNVIGTGTQSDTAARNGFQYGLRGTQMWRQGKDRFDLILYRTTVQQQLGASVYFPAFTDTEPEATTNGHMDETHIFSSNLLNDVLASYVRLNGHITCADCDVPFVPALGGPAGVGIFGPVFFIQNNFEYRDDVSWEHGAHTIKFGGDFKALQSNFNPNLGNTRPSYIFTNQFAFAADKPIIESGYNYNPVTGSRDIPVVAERQKEFAFYGQDTWKLKPNLTLNLGLRWEEFGKVSEATEVTNFVFPSGGTFIDQLTNASVEIVPTILKKLRIGNFGPRIGVAWDPTKTGTMAIRAGFGKFYDPLTSQVYGGSHYNPPINAAGTASVFVKGPQPDFALGTSDTYPYGFTYPAGYLGQGLDSHNGIIGARVGVTGTDPYLKTAYSLNWFLGVQKSFSHTWVAEADYIGSEGHHLYELYNVNRFRGDLVEHGGLFTGYNQSFGSMSYAQSNLNSFYSAVVGSLHGQAFHSLNVSFGYIFGKALDEQSSFSSADVVDAANIGLEHGRASFDARQRLTATAIWSLPGQHLSSAFLRNSIGGWQLSSVTILQAGTPFSVYCTAAFAAVLNKAGQVVGNTGCDYNADGDNYDRPNTPSFGNTKQASRSDYVKGLFVKSDFPAPALGENGNLGRNTFSGPGYAQSDMTLVKHFRTPWFGGEKSDVELRAESFNIFNRVNLTSMTSDLNASPSQFGKAVNTFTPRSFQFATRFTF